MKAGTLDTKLIGENLRCLQARQQWTVSELARRAHLSTTTISGYRRGTLQEPLRGSLQKIASALGVQLSEITGEADIGMERQDLERKVAEAALDLNRAIQELARWDSEHTENVQ